MSIHQGAIEQSLLDLTDRKFKVERNCNPEALNLDESGIEDEEAYPIELTVTRGHPTKESTTNASTNGYRGPDREVIKARYLIGCDGARSWVRKQFNIALEGTQTESVWGVMDIIPLTDFR